MLTPRLSSVFLSKTLPFSGYWLVMLALECTRTSVTLIGGVNYDSSTVQNGQTRSLKIIQTKSLFFCDWYKGRSHACYTCLPCSRMQQQATCTDTITDTINVADGPATRPGAELDPGRIEFDSRWVATSNSWEAALLGTSSANYFMINHKQNTYVKCEVKKVQPENMICLEMNLLVMEL